MEALSENLSYRIGEISDHDVQIYTPNGQHIDCLLYTSRCV